MLSPRIAMSQEPQNPEDGQSTKKKNWSPGADYLKFNVEC